MKNRNFTHKLLSVFAVFVSCSYAAFDDIGINARSIGVANAVLCQADTALNVFYNPAGLSSMKEVEAVLGYGKRYIGLTDGSDISNSSYAFALGVEKIGGFGVGWQTLGLTDAYQENILTFSYGKEMFDGLSMGINLKYFVSEVFGDAYTALDPVFNDHAYSKATFGADLGMLVSLGVVPVRFAVTLANAIQPNFGIASEEKPPVAVKIGASYFDNSMIVEIDGKIEAESFCISIGAEGWLLEKHLIVRTGFSLSERGLKEVCAGLGYREGQFDFNYSFNYPLTGMGSTSGSHQTSIAIRFENPLKYILARQKKEDGAGIPPVKTMTDTLSPETPAVDLPGVPLPDMRISDVNYTVLKGDTLKSLAVKFYQDAKLWTLIYEANKDKIKVGMLEEGVVLVIPRLTK